VSPRVPDPDAHPILSRLVREGSDDEIEDVVALIGFLGPVTDASESHRRIYPDLFYQRWLALPTDAIVDTAPVDADVPGGRTVVWVTRAAMRAPIFDPDVAVDELVAEHFVDGGMSTWSFLPDSRYDAARMLNLLAREEAQYS
jgi:hypothetical protein